MKRLFKKSISVVLVVLCVFNLLSCGMKNEGFSGEVKILNFGDYMSEEAISIFEKETGLKVIQDVFEANEEVIPVIESGAKYDVICISDYCIERMISKDLLLPIDKSKIPNIVNINKDKLKLLSVCDPDNAHAVPYFCGTMGIFFNKNKLDAINVPYPKKWSDLFNPNLKGELLMQSSIRDLYTAALKMHNFSVNSTSKEEIDICTEDFINQKPYVMGYMTDQIKEKMLSGEAGIAPLTSGDVQYVYLEGGKDDYCFIIPEEGTQIFIDAWCILKNAENLEGAYKFIDYMCREDVAKLNAEYVGYETVNDKTPDEDFLYMKQIEGAYIDYSNGNLELERDVADAIKYYSDGFNRIKAS
ncbi:MAG: ABC transporter substrate-binding protein [Lachnospiraceae bacterium]|nr:ABC transporter substrate-binding protein [Lachnospiraceae bacterium]